MWRAARATSSTAGRSGPHSSVNWVGSGRRVLDLGCRFGALTRSYVDGNEVVGLFANDICFRATKPS